MNTAGTAAAGGDNANPAVSDDGRFVVFQSVANNLVDNDTNGIQDIFFHDRDADADGIYDESGSISTTRVSASNAPLL